MPFYPDLPRWDPRVRPPSNVGALVGGLESGLGLYQSALKSAAMTSALQKEAAQAEAMKQYQTTGDPRLLYPVLSPEQALEAPGRMAKQQLDLANAAMDYWDSTKWGLTLDTYPEWRDRTTKMFPQINPAQFPPASQFRTPAEFEMWKTQKERMVAQYRTMPQQIAAESRERVARLGAESRERAAGMSAGARVAAANIGAASRKYVADTVGGRATKLTRYDQYRNDALARDPGLTEREILRNYNEDVARGRRIGAPPVQKGGGRYSAGRPTETTPGGARRSLSEMSDSELEALLGKEEGEEEED